tara:strand:+ start:416 stop:2116 length:1701 start_codon:yes stop_codon:yes gene_type:complete
MKGRKKLAIQSKRENAAAGFETEQHLNVSVSWAYPWKRVSIQDSDVQLYIAGHPDNLEALRDAVGKRDQAAIRNWIVAQRRCIGLISTTPEWVIIATDRVAGYPVFYKPNQEGGIEIGTDPRRWIGERESGAIEIEQVPAYLASGYCIGDATLVTGTYRVLPGEIVCYSHDSFDLTKDRYYSYRPQLGSDSNMDSRNWSGELLALLKQSIRRVIERANGNTIWIPLSAGYDSRAVLAGLLDQGYDNIRCFSYGNAHNMEAKVAEEIATKAGVPWEFCESKRAWSSSDFHGEEGTDYFLYAGGIGTTPCLTEYAALRHLSRLDRIKADDIVVNGQSGDFLTGGHLPKVDTERALVSFIESKHYGLLKGEVSALDIPSLWDKWKSIYGGSGQFNDPKPFDADVRDYLTFEWQERQSRYVVNQQRAYDYLGIKWELPLWDADLIEFFQEAPVECHRDQSLYLNLLKEWNPLGLFDDGRKPYNPWMNYRWVALGLASLARLVGKKNEAFKLLYYYSDLNYQYSYYGFGVYREHRNAIRNPVSFFTTDHLQRLAKAMGQAIPVTEIAALRR